MNAIVFTGPTLSAEVARSEFEATYMPPAAQGDVYRASLNRPVAIGIIDGVFDQVPSVWHKEILWAMSQGIYVYGSASMGALRAAELADFGMAGVGTIYRDYRTGVLEDDDEVAVIHGTPEQNFRVLSDAMVNIRQTLTRAAAEGVVTSEAASALEKIAKTLPYPERSYERVLQVAKNSDLRASELEALRTWLPKNKIDQKRDDALEMLRVMNSEVRPGRAPMRVSYKFEHTVVWNALINSAGLMLNDAERPGDVSMDDILSEIWANPDLCLQAYQYATIRHLARQAAQATGASVSPDVLAKVEKEFKSDRSIVDDSALRTWLHRYQMTPTELADMILHEALLHESSLAAAPFPHRWMVDWLRISGQFDTVMASVLRRKTDSAHSSSEVNANDPSVVIEPLLEWYLEQLPSEPTEGNSSRLPLNYLRRDWERFVQSLVKRHQSQRTIVSQDAVPDAPSIVPKV